MSEKNFFFAPVIENKKIIEIFFSNKMNTE